MGLILDSTVCISAERRGLSAFEMFLALPAGLRSEEIAFSVITLSELAFGLRRARAKSDREMRQKFLSDLEESFDAISASRQIAVNAGFLQADLQARGQTTDLADILIAATALEIGFGVATSNVRHFQRVPGLRVVEL